MEIKLPIDSLTGVILAGGRSSRFGSDKVFARYKGESFLDHALAVMGHLFQKVVVVTNNPEKFEGLSVSLLKDKIPFRGPAGAIATALRAVKTQGIFAVACDMPLLSEGLILKLLKEEDGSSLVLYRHRIGVEPLCAIYRYSLLPILEYRLRFGRDDLHSLCEESISVQKVPISTSEKRSLLNVNTQKQYISLLDDSHVFY